MRWRWADSRALVTGYVFGSVPFGLMLGWATRGLDVRGEGSGSTGSTNVARVAGPAAGALTFALDTAKGTAAVTLARRTGAGPGGQVAAGLGAMLGHAFPVFAGFRGGKCVATGFGALIPQSPEVTAYAVAGGLSTLAATRTVSLASLVAATSATVGAGVSAVRGGSRSVLLFTGLAGALIALRHADNVRRLARGVEPRLGTGKAARRAPGGGRS